MCNYVSVAEHEFNAELVMEIRSMMPNQLPHASLPPDVMDVVWSVSARVRREIEKRLGLGVQNDLIGIMKFVSDWRIQ